MNVHIMRQEDQESACSVAGLRSARGKKERVLQRTKENSRRQKKVVERSGTRNRLKKAKGRAGKPVMGKKG